LQVVDDRHDNAVPYTLCGRSKDFLATLPNQESAQLNPRFICVRCAANVTGNTLWRPSKEADVLLLGDRFSNIFSFEAMGGESAVFAEHLSVALGRPIDCILRNNDASFATREILSNELGRGRERLAGKKPVIREFATRELSFGNWKLLDLKLGEAKPSRFLTLKPGEELEVSGTVKTISPVPWPDSVPYKDHIEALHLVDSEGADSSGDVAAESQGQAVVYLWSMRGNVWTSAARLRPGDRVKLRLRPWRTRRYNWRSRFGARC
jgi:alginate O-acetyltransferase complex protein AlgJ